MKGFVDEGPTIRIYYDLEGQRRKDLVKALGEILLWEPKYLGAPTFSYQVGNYIVTQIGAIICPECCTKEIAQQIMLKLRERGFDHTGTNLMLYVVSYNGPPVKTTLSNFIVNQIFPILTLAASRATPHI